MTERQPDNGDKCVGSRHASASDWEVLLVVDCLCGHVEEDHPNGKECEGTIDTTIGTGEVCSEACPCVVYEENEELVDEGDGSYGDQR